MKPNVEILAAIIGTAGHVDHGKTSLVKLLTGCDTDRLPEERARGMSIDLGFAPCLLHGKRLAGIVDVPGHRDFIRNMVAGAASVDVLLLVIAADDGIMPQTREHLQIVRLLRVPRALVALTKTDLVSSERLAEVRREIALFLSEHGLSDAAIIEVSNKTGEGIGEVRDEIDRLVERVCQRAPDQRAFRMNVERVFSVAGYGTVVTGIPLSGSVAVGDVVEVLAGATPQQAIVRTVQSYKLDAHRARAGCCCAINLREVPAESVRRGVTVAVPGVYRATREAIVHLENIADGHALGRRTDVVLHIGTAAVNASVKLLTTEKLGLGEGASAHVAFDEPLVMAAGDKFVMRLAALGITCGGGVVLSAEPQRLRRNSHVHERLAAAVAAIRRGDHLGCAAVAGPHWILSGDETLRLTQHTDASARAAALADAAAELQALGGGAYIVRAHAADMCGRLRRLLERYHASNPMVWGMTPAHFGVAAGVSVHDVAGLVAVLAPHIVLKHERIALSTFEPALTARQAELRRRVLDQVTAAGVNGMARSNLVAACGASDTEIGAVIKMLCQDQTAVVLEGNLVLRSVFEESRHRLLAMFERQRVVDLAAFRTAIGASRKTAVAMLDLFDQQGLTRRVPEGRVLARPQGLVATSK